MRAISIPRINLPVGRGMPHVFIRVCTSKCSAYCYYIFNDHVVNGEMKVRKRVVESAEELFLGFDAVYILAVGAVIDDVSGKNSSTTAMAAAFPLLPMTRFNR